MMGVTDVMSVLAIVISVGSLCVTVGITGRR